jgi:protein-S-isoprenylcysteine O-methyltransferase Ste14
MFARVLTRRFAANYLSTLAFIGLSYWIIAGLSPFHRNVINAQWEFLRIHELMHALIAVYVIALIPYYARYPWLRSKAFVFLQGLWFAIRRSRRAPSRARLARHARDRMRLPFRESLTPAAKQAGLALLLKFFFAPLMINWCLGHVSDMSGSIARVHDGWTAGQRGLGLFDSALFWACFQAILFVDTFLFTMGYIVEIPALRNRIRSVDPTFFGWFICLACYPPFNDFTGWFFPWQSNDFPQFDSLPGSASQTTKDTIHVVANVGLLALMSFYSWASVALGFKASNLTNRGIVSRGPYALVRHPAYAAKNLAWWIGGLPTLYLLASAGDYRGLLYALLSLSGWSLIYALRALTEERHLLFADNGYAEYQARVRWRFIPGVL